MFIINAPYFFSAVWKIIKPWLDEKTTSKIYIFSKNYEEELRKLVDDENIPK